MSSVGLIADACLSRSNCIRSPARLGDSRIPHLPGTMPDPARAPRQTVAKASRPGQLAGHHHAEEQLTAHLETDGELRLQAHVEPSYFHLQQWLSGHGDPAIAEYYRRRWA